jgi:LmbE family N-acetylglucosaminyl deacetylase
VRGHRRRGRGPRFDSSANRRAYGEIHLLELKPAARGRRVRVLCLGAHSDDIEIGCGATILQLARARPRAEFRWVVWSATGVRATEAKQGARKFLGSAAADAVALHGFRDGYFPAEFANLKDSFETLAREFTPDVIFTHGRDDRHQDHRIVSDLTWNTFRDHLILEYEIPKWDGDHGQPNSYVPVSRSEALRKARALMDVFGTQRNKDWFSEETFLGLMRLRGMECRAPEGYAEAFNMRKAILDF